MKIEKTGFGWIIIEGKKYNSDLLILADGEIINRYEDFTGDNHILAIPEAQKLLKNNPVVVIVGSGQAGVLRVPVETENFLKAQGVSLLVEVTPKAIEIFNQTKEKKAALFHLTC